MYSFTTNFPKLRGEPEKWYKEVNRLAKISKMLWRDLDSLFEIFVPTDLWKECKHAVTWSDEEPARTGEGLPGAEVQDKYNEVIKWLIDKVPEKQVNWEKIFRINKSRKSQCMPFTKGSCKCIQNTAALKIQGERMYAHSLPHLSEA